MEIHLHLYHCWGTSSRKFTILTFVSAPGEYRTCMNMVNVTVMTQKSKKMHSQIHLWGLFGLYNSGGSYTYSTHSKLQYTKTVNQGGGTSSHKLYLTHFNFGTKFCTPLGQECQGSLQALVAILLYFCSHCKLKIVSPVGVILQLAAGKGGSLTLDKADGAITFGITWGGPCLCCRLIQPLG